MRSIEKSLNQVNSLIKEKNLSEAVDLLLDLNVKEINNLSVIKIVAQLFKIPGHHLSKLKPSSQELSGLMDCYENGDLEGVVNMAENLLSIYPFSAMLYNVMGSAFQEMKKYDAAITYYEKSLKLESDSPQIYFNLGEARFKLGQVALARNAYEMALRLSPNFALARVGLGKTFVIDRSSIKAEEQFRLAIRIDKNYTEAYLQLAKLYIELDSPDQALSILDLIKPNQGERVSKRELVAAAYHQQGRHMECLEEYDGLLREKPNHLPRATQLFAANYLEEISLDQHLTMAKSYGDLVRADKTDIFSTWNCKVNPEKLRVGIVSGDFYQHVVGRMINQLITNFPELDLELLAFSTNEIEDSISQNLKRNFSDWIPLSHSKSFKESAEKIYIKAPNILIDLNGHTKFNALPVFAFRPAPVQVTWLGYSGTTGLETIDYKLADSYVVSEAEEKFYTESIWKLPNCFLCPIIPSDAGDISSLPAIKNGYLTFGSLNRFEKIGPAVIECWSEILKALPGSRLLLKNAGGERSYIVNEIRQKFLNNGIDESHLIFEDKSERRSYFDSYRRIDIALDTFPFTGGVTTTDALWMGVPVLAKSGKDTFISHQGESILKNAGLSDWIASNPEDYVDKAINFASDLSCLESFRKSARILLANSPLFDSKRFALDFGDALRAMWQVYIDRNS